MFGIGKLKDRVARLERIGHQSACGHGNVRLWREEVRCTDCDKQVFNGSSRACFDYMARYHLKKAKMWRGDRDLLAKIEEKVND